MNFVYKTKIQNIMSNNYNINLKDDSIYSLFIKIAIPPLLELYFKIYIRWTQSLGKTFDEALAAIGQIFPIYLHHSFRCRFKYWNNFLI